MRWFRGWGGREGTALVSGVVSVGGLVSFDSSNGAQARIWAKVSTKDSAPKTNYKLETRQRSTEDDTHTPFWLKAIFFQTAHCIRVLP